MADGANTPEFKQLADLLSQERDLLLAFVFGSMAAGNPGRDSDVDVAVLAARDLPEERRLQLMQLISGFSGRPVDLIDLRTAGPLIGQQVLKHGLLLFVHEPADLGNLLSRIQTDAEDFLQIRDRMIRERLDTWTRG